MVKSHAYVLIVKDQQTVVSVTLRSSDGMFVNCLGLMRLNSPSMVERTVVARVIRTFRTRNRQKHENRNK
jgi:hypothetical protein